jgi:anti-anti-sigma regulatory factor
MSAPLAIEDRPEGEWENARRITLGAMQGQAAAPALREALLDAILAGRSAVVDASGVHMIGTGALQVLLAARPNFVAAGLGLRVEQPSHAVVQALAAIGFQAAELAISP